MTMMMINYMVSTWATLKVLLIMTQWHDMTGEHETMWLKSLLQISFLCPLINYSTSAKQHFGYAINQHQNRNAFFCKLQRLVDEETIKPTSKKQNAVLVMKMIDGHFDSSSWWPRSSKVRQWNDTDIGNDNENGNDNDNAGSPQEPGLCHQELLEVVGGKENSCLETNYDSRIWRDFVLDSLPEKLRKKGGKSSKYIEVCRY